MLDARKNIRLRVLELASADLMGDLEVLCISCLRYLPGRRSVWRARCEGREILLKLYDLHPKQERDARDEWQKIVELHEHGMDIPEPLFFGESDEGALAVAMDFIPDGVTLDVMLPDAKPEDQKEVLNQLVALHAKHHESGCYQADDHLGNYLWSCGKLWMLDGESFVLKSGALSEVDRMKNMSMLAANIPLRLRLTYDEAFAAFYDRGLGDMKSAIAQAIQIRARNYYRKTRRSCSEFEHKEDRGISWLACRDLSPDLKQKLIKNPDQFFEGVDGDDLLKNGNTCTVVEVLEGETSYILKRYNQKSLGYRLAHFFMTPRALLSWSNGHVLRLFGVPTPRPVACLLIKTGRMVRRGYLLMEKISGVPLSKVDTQKIINPPQAIPHQFTKRWGELDTLLATHGDMKASNFIVTENDELVLIDLDSFQFHRSLADKQRRQTKDMNRFMRNWQKFPKAQSAFQRATRNIQA